MKRQGHIRPSPITLSLNTYNRRRIFLHLQPFFLFRATRRYNVLIGIPLACTHHLSTIVSPVRIFKGVACTEHTANAELFRSYTPCQKISELKSHELPLTAVIVLIPLIPYVSRFGHLLLQSYIVSSNLVCSRTCTNSSSQGISLLGAEYNVFFRRIHSGFNAPQSHLSCILLFAHPFGTVFSHPHLVHSIIIQKLVCSLW